MLIFIYRDARTDARTTFGNLCKIHFALRCSNNKLVRAYHDTCLDILPRSFVLFGESQHSMALLQEYRQYIPPIPQLSAEANAASWYTITEMYTRIEKPFAKIDSIAKWMKKVPTGE